MKYSFKKGRSKLTKRLVIEDMQYLQKKMSGKSVYRKISMHYSRKPKHKKAEYQYF
jgi:hypothetical protein